MRNRNSAKKSRDRFISEVDESKEHIKCLQQKIRDVENEIYVLSLHECFTPRNIDYCGDKGSIQSLFELL